MAKQKATKVTEQDSEYPIDENPLFEAEGVHQRAAEEAMNKKRMEGIRSDSSRRKDALF